MNDLEVDIWHDFAWEEAMVCVAKDIFPIHTARIFFVLQIQIRLTPIYYSIIVENFQNDTL